MTSPPADTGTSPRPRPAPGERVVLATHNKGKLAEFETLLARAGLRLVAASALGIPEPDETGTTFAENAALKARAAAEATGNWALADDSGLVVPALDGAPGVYSARWAGPDRDFAAAMRRVHAELKARHGRANGDVARAAFVAALCLTRPEGPEYFVEGRTEGRLMSSPRGEHGFGYDPIFVPLGATRTFGEMIPEEKATHSHRARAVTALLAALGYPRGASCLPLASSPRQRHTRAVGAVAQR